MADVAKKIEIVVNPGGSASLLVDGVEFPWLVNSDGLELGSKVGEYPMLTVSFLAEQIVTRFAEPEIPVEQEDETRKVGYTFQLEGKNTPEPANNVLVLKHHGDEVGGVPYLHRVNGLWSWSEYDSMPGSTEETWEDAAWFYKGVLEVIKVDGQ